MHSLTNIDDIGLPDAEDRREGRSNTAIFPFDFWAFGPLADQVQSSSRDTSSAALKPCVHP